MTGSDDFSQRGVPGGCCRPGRLVDIEGDPLGVTGLLLPRDNQEYRSPSEDSGLGADIPRSISERFSMRPFNDFSLNFLPHFSCFKFSIFLRFIFLLLLSFFFFITTMDTETFLFRFWNWSKRRKKEKKIIGSIDISIEIPYSRRYIIYLSIE